MTQLGELSLWFALLMAAWCVTLSVQGAVMRRPAFAASGARGMHAAFFFIVLSAIGLAAAFLGDDFGVRYVALHSGLVLQPFYKICALWSGTEGTILVSALLLTGTSSVAIVIARRAEIGTGAAAAASAVLGLFAFAAIAASAFAFNPFARALRAPADGRGLDPYLQNIAMAIHPPLAMLGAASLLVPVALLIALRFASPHTKSLRSAVHASLLLSWSLIMGAILTALHWNYVSPGGRTLWASPTIIKAGFAAWMLCGFALGAFVWRDRAVTEAQSLRRYAGAVCTLAGAVVLVSGIAARRFERNYVAQLADGEVFRAVDAWNHPWTFTSQGASRLERPGVDVTAVALMPSRDGVRQPFISSESRDYYGTQGLNVFPPMMVAAIRSTIAQDLYVMLSDAGEGRAALRISFRPLVELVWIGGVLFALGGLALFWPPKLEFAP